LSESQAFETIAWIQKTLGINYNFYLFSPSEISVWNAKCFSAPLEQNEMLTPCRS